MNCRLYLPGLLGDCAEAGAQPPADRERANFCDWFSLNPKFRQATTGQSGAQKKAQAAKAAFDNLFN